MEVDGEEERVYVGHAPAGFAVDEAQFAWQLNHLDSPGPSTPNSGPYVRSCLKLQSAA